MVKLSNKFIVVVLGICVIGSTIVSCAILPSNSSTTKVPSEIENISSSEDYSQINSDINNQVINSSIQSSVVSQKETASSNENSQKVVNKTTTSATFKQNSAEITTNQNSSSESSSSSSVATKNIRYPVINPETGLDVYPTEPNYATYKAELGGDAGTVPTKDSTACQAQIQKIIAANEEKQKEADAASKANHVEGQLASSQPDQTNSVSSK